MSHCVSTLVMEATGDLVNICMKCKILSVWIIECLISKTWWEHLLCLHDVITNEIAIFIGNMCRGKNMRIRYNFIFLIGVIQYHSNSTYTRSLHTLVNSSSNPSKTYKYFSFNFFGSRDPSLQRMLQKLNWLECTLNIWKFKLEKNFFFFFTHYQSNMSCHQTWHLHQELMDRTC